VIPPISQSEEIMRTEIQDEEIEIEDEDELF